MYWYMIASNYFINYWKFAAYGFHSMLLNKFFALLGTKCCKNCNLISHGISIVIVGELEQYYCFLNCLSKKMCCAIFAHSRHLHGWYFEKIKIWTMFFINRIFTCTSLCATYGIFMMHLNLEHKAFLQEKLRC